METDLVLDPDLKVHQGKWDYKAIHPAFCSYPEALEAPCRGQKKTVAESL